MRRKGIMKHTKYKNYIILICCREMGRTWPRVCAYVCLLKCSTWSGVLGSKFLKIKRKNNKILKEKKFYENFYLIRTKLN